jgi:ankyrin repeat protein
MPGRDLPPRPHLDHLKNEAKTLQRAFERGDADVVARVTAVLGARAALKRTEAQRVIAREYGFASWARLRTHVEASRGVDDAITAFLDAVQQQDERRARQVLQTEPRIVTASLHVAAVLGDAAAVQRLIAQDPAAVHARVGTLPADPLLHLTYSPWHGESAERDEGLATSARALLEAGADPNTTDARFGVPALYAVTGVRSVPRIARMLLDAGAKATDGESVFHAAEHFHEDALELLWEYGVELNVVGDWGNTPLYFLLRYHDVGAEENVRKGVLWLLAHGADPNVRCTKAQETSLHLAVRRRQHPDIVRLLLDHGADVNARRVDGRSVWLLARRAGFDTTLLEQAGAVPEPLSAEDMLLAACGRGDVERAAQLTSPALLEALDPEELKLLPDAAAREELRVVQACLAAGFPVDTRGEGNATALHFACIEGFAPIVEELLRAGADYSLEDPEHHATAMGWALFGADLGRVSQYEDTVRALLRAGARPIPNDYWPSHPGVVAVLAEFASTAGA